ncbi:phytase [Henriciella algicola]|uniref:3-phytase n=1 Tax=Henriciella algicola TaxID=1608422 RepID=A0A399RP40_9PROT|nr:phytase [Henriciella algicola]RIJ31425.1 3-phytase [Henriciella algicola]
MTFRILLLAGAAAATLAACATDDVWVDDGIVAQPIAAAFETDPMPGTGDRADDPALWVHAGDVSKSLILGTNKDEGLHVYDLSGAELQFLDVGQVNNVDVRGNVAAASNDEFNTITMFSIDADTGEVTHTGDVQTGKAEPYGICMGEVDDTVLIIPTYKDGSIQIWESTDAGVTLQRSLQVGQFGQLQLEGCVVDDAAGIAFIGEEEHGIWKLDLRQSDSTPEIVDTIEAGNGLVADVEGLSLWVGEGTDGYLVASAQAADRFVVYDRAAPHAVRGVFTVTESEDGSVDAVTHTDGLHVSSAALPGYPRGIVIVQDDANPTSEIDQNFKIADWADIEVALGLND